MAYGVEPWVIEETWPMHWVSRTLAVLEAADEAARTPADAEAAADAASIAEIAERDRRELAAGRQPPPGVVRADGQAVNGQAVNGQAVPS